MAEPKTMALMATMAAGTALSAGAAMSQGYAIRDTEKMNAKLAEVEGEESLMAAVSDSSDLARQHRRLLARMRVTQGASGLGTEGTFGEVMLESSKNMAADRQRIVDAGISGKYSKQVEAAGRRASGKGAVKAGRIDAATTLLGGATTGMETFR